MAGRKGLEFIHVELVPDKKVMSREKNLTPPKEPEEIFTGSIPRQTDAAKAAPVL